MGGKSRICEICGRRERHNPGFFASFPKNEQRCRSWVQIVGNEDLVHIPIENLCAVRFICGDHFINKDFNKKGNRLKKHAYPKLQLLRQPLTDHQLRGFPAHVASKSVPAPVCSMDLTTFEPVASTSKTPLATATTQNIPAPPTVHAMAEAAINLGASASKTPVATATQNRLASVYTIEGTAVEPAVSRKTQLSTSTTQNIMVPASISAMETSAVEPELSTGGTSLATSTAHNMIGVNTIQARLLEELKNVKATVRSLRRNAKLLEQLESPMVKEIVSRLHEFADYLKSGK